MSQQIKSRMLRAIAYQPQALRAFTEGDVTLVVAARHVDRYADEMVADGLIVKRDGLYHPTEFGLVEVNKPTTKAEPRCWCACSQPGGSYKPKQWIPAREWANDHLQHRSLGT